MRLCNLCQKVRKREGQIDASLVIDDNQEICPQCGKELPPLGRQMPEEGRSEVEDIIMPMEMLERVRCPQCGSVPHYWCPACNWDSWDLDS